MAIAQTILATPIVIALVHRAINRWTSKRRVILELFVIGRSALLTAFLAAFGRAIAEADAIIIVCFAQCRPFAEAL